MQTWLPQPGFHGQLRCRSYLACEAKCASLFAATKLAQEEGIEPPTTRLTAERSTVELLLNKVAVVFAVGTTVASLLHRFLGRRSFGATSNLVNPTGLPTARQCFSTDPRIAYLRRQTRVHDISICSGGINRSVTSVALKRHRQCDHPPQTWYPREDSNLQPLVS